MLAPTRETHTHVGADSISARAHYGRNSVFLPLINPHAYLIAHKIHRQQPHKRCNQPAGTLSGGEQQMLAMGRALMCKPKMLLLDEPSMGLSPLLVKEIFKIIRQVNRNGVTVLLVEQNAKMALEIANRAYVLETGTIKMEGEATELANNIEVRKAYLGCE